MSKNNKLLFFGVPEALCLTNSRYNELFGVSPQGSLNRAFSVFAESSTVMSLQNFAYGYVSIHTYFFVFILQERALAFKREGFGIKMESDLPHLICVDDDILSTGVTLYHLNVGHLSLFELTCNTVFIPLVH